MLPIVRSAVRHVTSSSWLASLLDSRGPRGSLSLVLPTLPEPSGVVDLIRHEAAAWGVPAVVVPSSQTGGHGDGTYQVCVQCTLDELDNGRIPEGITVAFVCCLLTQQNGQGEGSIHGCLFVVMGFYRQSQSWACRK